MFPVLIRFMMGYVYGINTHKGIFQENQSVQTKKPLNLGLGRVLQKSNR